MKSREHIVMNGKAAFYACIFDDFRKAAIECGWALGLHGSLASDMDIMAMPWTEGAKPVEIMIKALSDCLTENPFKDRHTIAHKDKPNNRVVYSINIWADFYLDINVIEPQAAIHYSTLIEQKDKEIEELKTGILNAVTTSGEFAEEIAELKSQIKELVEGLERLKGGDNGKIFISDSISIIINELLTNYNSKP